MLNVSWLVIQHRGLLVSMKMAKYGDRFAFGGCYFVNKDPAEGNTARKSMTPLWQVRRHFPSIGAISDLSQGEMHKHNGFRSQF